MSAARNPFGPTQEGDPKVLRRLFPLAVMAAIVCSLVPSADAREPRTPRQPRRPAAAQIQRPTVTAQRVAPAAAPVRRTAPAPAAVAPVYGSSGIESQILSLINSGRRGVGRSALRSHGGLKAVARQHSANMAARGGLTHAGFISRLNRGAPGWSSGCENVARYRGPSTNIAGIMYSLWLNSPSHRRCMFDARGAGYTLAGVGVYRDRIGGWWATLELARP